MSLNISAGFLPEKCCESFPSVLKYLNRFFEENIYDDPEQLRKSIDLYRFTPNHKKRVIDRINNLEIEKVRYIYTATCFLAHRYIWCIDSNYKNTLPACIGVPWWYSSQIIGIPPVLTHAGEIKQIMSEYVCKVIAQHQHNRENITKETLYKFFSRNRRFNSERCVRNTIELFEDSVYENYGVDFDRNFGTQK